ncbi:transposase [Roseomonas chloroacetimidivorans]|uniref:transposase n=1 Tax=Roseomonas chloroacetimidivorans TaxID=1766656 RepID=UPI003C73BD0A
MSDTTVVPLRQPETVEDPLTAVLRSGARRLLAQAIEAEAEAFLAEMKGERLPDGRERLVRHGHGPERLVQTGIGPVAVQRVMLRDRGAGEEAGGERIRFTSALLPRWARRTRSLDALLPILYLRRVSMGDFGEALEEVSPATRHQRCWVHKTANVLDKLPRSVQPAAKADLREIWQAPDRDTAETAITTFAGKYGAKYERAVTCLVKDRDALLSFYDFPAEHWDHLRTSNPIESVFATVRHRTVRTRGALSQDTARLMVFKLVMAAAKTWRWLKGENQLPKLIQGVTFKNSVEVTNTPAQNAA